MGKNIVITKYYKKEEYEKKAILLFSGGQDSNITRVVSEKI